MRVPRIYYNGDLMPNTSIRLAHQAAVHVRRVLRLKKEAPLLVFNSGRAYQAVIQTADASGVVVRILVEQPCHTESRLVVDLAQVMSRGTTMDYTVQKAVELGVHCIMPLFSQRCGVVLDASKQQAKRQHWQQVAIHAAEQSGRVMVPEVHLPVSMQDWLLGQDLQTDAMRLVLDPSGCSLSQLVGVGADLSHVVLLVGPEGGFTDEEKKLACTHQFQPCALGPRILRTETAASAAISVFQYLVGYA